VIDAAGQSLDDLVLAGVHGRHVDRDGAVGQHDAPLLRLLRDLEGVGVLEQRLGRDAAPVEAGATEHGRPLDAGRAEAELRGTDGCDVATGSGADDHDVVCVRQER
jgi:hypothetical protein